MHWTNTRFCRDLADGTVCTQMGADLLVHTTQTGRETDTAHIFFRMGDGSYPAFFEAPDLPFDFKPQHDDGLHITLEVDQRLGRWQTDHGRVAP